MTTQTPFNGRPLGSTNACLTHREIGKAMGLSQQRIQQLEQAALEKLRNHPVMRELAISLNLAVPPLTLWRCRWCQGQTPDGEPRCGSCGRGRPGAKAKA